MSVSFCPCPLGSEITSITDETCKFGIDLITRIAIQRKNTTSPFVAGNLITLEASWDTFLGASDVTKIQITPKFVDTEMPPSNPLLYGGNDNSTSDGEAIVQDYENPRVTANFLNLSPEIQYQLRDFTCDTTLTVYLIDASGNVYCKSTVTDEYSGIPITSFSIGTRGLGGRVEPDKIPIGWNFRGDWDKNLVKVTPDFDILSKTNA